jgi:phosphatidylinositol alpha-1,6-mannosyltransferase
VILPAEASEVPKKRIIGLFTNLFGIGGVQEAGRVTARALFEISRCRAWSFDFLSLNDPHGAQTLLSEDLEIPFRGFARKKARFVLAATRIALSRDRSHQAIVLAAHPHLAMPAAIMQIASGGLRVLVMSHGIEVWRPLPRMRRWSLHRAAGVLAPSAFTSGKLIEIQKIPSSKVHRVPWPLSPEFLRLAASPQKLSVPRNFPRGRVVLTVGRWMASERYKGADELIRAIARLQSRIADLHLVVVGTGDDLPRLRQLTAELHVEDLVCFLETLSNEEVAACYANADLFALPSTGEGFGFVFLEAMAFAKPVVGLACGGAIDVIQHERNGLLISPDHTDQLAGNLERLLQDPALSRSLGNAGAERVRSNYSFPVFRNELEKIVDEIAHADRS